MATSFADYYKASLANYDPARQQATAAANAEMADRGLYNSTGAVGKVASLSAAYDAQARAAAEQAAQYAQNFDESKRQFGINAANQDRQTYLQWFDAVNNLALAKKQIGGYKKKDIQYQKRPAWLDSYWNNKSLAKVGDGKGKVVAGEKLGKSNFADSGGKTNAEVSMANTQKNAEASLALERARLQQTIRAYQDSQKAEKANPWDEAAGYLDQQLTVDADPTIAGIQRAFMPSDLINRLQAGGIDVMKAVNDPTDPNHERALAMLKSLYPQTWQDRIAGRFDMQIQDVVPRMTAQEAVKLGDLASYRDTIGIDGGTPTNGMVSSFAPPTRATPLKDRWAAMFNR